VNILRFFDRRVNVISDGFLEFIPIGHFEIEGWGSCVEGRMGASGVDGNVSEPRPES